MNSSLLKSKILFSVFFLLLTPFFTFASESISSYLVTIKINSDSSLEIEERIIYDFDNNLKRGIYRDIPLIFQRDGNRYLLEVSDIEVLEDGRPAIVNIIHSADNLRIETGGDTPRLRGLVRYNISYKVENGLIYEEDTDLFYWNSIGPNWSVPINGAEAIIILPDEISEEIEINCFIGPSGSNNQCSFNRTDLSEIEFYGHNWMLGSGSGMTVMIRIPKGYVIEKDHKIIEEAPKWLLFLLLIPITLSFYGLLTLYRKGKEPRKKRVVREYNVPEDILVSDAMLVLNRHATGFDLTPLIISLAIRGYIKIFYGSRKLFFFNNKAFLFLKIKDDSSLQGADKVLMEELFSSDFSISKEKAREYIPENHDILKDLESAISVVSTEKLSGNQKVFKISKKIEDQAKEDSVRKGLFEQEFKKAKKEAGKIILSYFVFPALLLIVSSIVLGSFFFPGQFFGIWNFFVLIITLTYLILFLFFMVLTVNFPRITEKGLLMKEHLLGFKQYIEVAEKERIAFHFDPKKNPELFEKTLPYAIILGVEKKWSSHLRDFDYRPNWYSSSIGAGVFRASDLTAMTRGISSTTGGSSGGSSGGGMGGGGGGSR